MKKIISVILLFSSILIDNIYGSETKEELLEGKFIYIQQPDIDYPENRLAGKDSGVYEDFKFEFDHTKEAFNFHKQELLEKTPKNRHLFPLYIQDSQGNLYQIFSYAQTVDNRKVKEQILTATGYHFLQDLEQKEFEGHDIKYKTVIFKRSHRKKAKEDTYPLAEIDYKATSTFYSESLILPVKRMEEDFILLDTDDKMPSADVFHTKVGTFAAQYMNPDVIKSIGRTLGYQYQESAHLPRVDTVEPQTGIGRFASRFLGKELVTGIGRNILNIQYNSRDKQ